MRVCLAGAEREELERLRAGVTSASEGLMGGATTQRMSTGGSSPERTRQDANSQERVLDDRLSGLEQQIMQV